MPEKRITYKKAPNGTVYAYHTVRAYRNKRGQPTSEVVAIGKKDTVTGKLIPNSRYFEIYQRTTPPKQPEQSPSRIQNCGNIAALEEIAKQTGLSAVLKMCFPQKWEQMMACASYMVCEGNVMMYIDNWFDETRVNFSNRLDDIACSKLFASITEEERREFFITWIKHRSEQEYIVYDVTSISTYSDNIDIAEWGYNRDRDALPQINLGMYYGVTTEMPVYYTLYSGSIPDKSYLEFMMADTRDLGIINVCFVIDRGFITEDNLIYLRELGFSFITAMPGNLLETISIIDQNKWSVRKTANRISEYELYGQQRSIELYGLELHAHIYYDPEKQAVDEKELYAKIDKLRDALEKMNRSKRVTKKYKDYFLIDNDDKSKLEFELNTDKVDEKRERAGIFVLLSNKKELNSYDVLKIYRNRDVIEKNFDQFKNHLDFKRMRTHWAKTTSGKMFIGFLALILRSYMLRLLKQSNDTKHLTFERVLLELRKIKAVTLSDMSEVLMPLTKLQKTILSVLGVTISLESPST